MKVLFLNITKHFEYRPDRRYSHPRHLLPPVDIGYCASMLEKAGHEASLIDTSVGSYDIPYIRDKIINDNIGVVVLKPDITAYRLTLGLAEGIRAFSRYTICMGPRASISPELFIFENSPIDLCIIGEPEYTLVEIIERITSGRGLAGIDGTGRFDKSLVTATPRDLCADLDSLPFPKHDLFIGKGYSFQYPVRINSKKKFAVMLTSRGCPYSCIFCSPIKRVSFGKEYRARSPYNVADEMELLKSKGVNVVYFLDDLFSYDRNRVKLICDEIIARKINMIWAAQIRADFCEYGLLRKMKEAGCDCVNVGIESVNDATLRMIEKGTTKEDIEKTIGYCRQLGINTVGNFIIGIPGQTREDLSQNLEFAKRLKLDLAENLIFTPYPGSRAFELYGKAQDLDKYSDYDNAVVSYCELGVDELRRAQLKFYRSYYFNLKFIFSFFAKNKKRIIKNLFSELAFLKNVFLFLIQKA